MEPVVYTNQALSAFPSVATQRIGASQSYVERAQVRALPRDDDTLSKGESFLLLTALSTLAATILMALP